MKIIRYNKKTGDIVSFLSVDDDFDLSTYNNETYGCMQSDIPVGSTNFFIKNNEIVSRPEKPSKYHFWDGSTWVQNTDLLSAKIRLRRDELLSSCDWVVSKYLELGEQIPQEWKEYRQNLRDLPQQDGFPNNVVFPKRP